MKTTIINTCIKNCIKVATLMLVIFSVCITGKSFGQSQAQVISTEGIDIPYKKFVLDNGLTLIVHEDHKAPIVAIDIWYHVGSKDEKPGKTGFAHLFEHLMFNGSEHYNSDYFKPVQDAGASDVNGSTTEDRTNYIDVFPTSALDFVLWMESDRMGYLKAAISQERLDEQCGVVQNEVRQGKNAPYGITQELICKGAFPPGHPYSWDIGGSLEDLGAAKLDDVHEWFRTYYGPNNAVLVLAGDITPGVALEKVKKYFGDIPPSPPIAKQKAWISKRSGSHHETAQDMVAQPRLYKIWNVPQWGTPEADYLDLVSSILATGKSARLYKRLVMDEQIATNVSSYNESREISGVFTVQVDLKPEADLARVEQIVMEELNTFIQQGPTQNELLLVKNRIISGFIRGMEQIGGFSGKADILATCETFGGDPALYKTFLKRMYDATAADLQNTATKWLTDGDYTLEVLPFPDVKASSEGVDRSTFPATEEPPLARFPEVQRTQLSNGLKVVLAEVHSIPLVVFSMLTNAGYAADAGNMAGLSRLTSDLMDEGTNKRTGTELSDELNILGARITTGASLDNSFVALSTLKQNLDPSCVLFAEVILTPSFTESDFTRLQKLQINRIKRDKTVPSSIATRVYPKVLYGEGHPYGNPWNGCGFEETVAKVTLNDVRDFHKKWFLPNNSTLIVVGDIIMDEILPRLEKLFGAWKKGQIPGKQIPAAAPGQKPAVYIVDKPEAPQSEVFAGFLAPSPKDKGAVAMDIMNKIFGSEAGARLFMNIREDKHWSYGAYSFFNDVAGQRPFMMWAPVQTDKTKETMQEILKEVKGIIGDKPVTQDEFRNAVNSQSCQLAGLWESMWSVEGSIEQIVNYGFPDDYFSKYPGMIKALTWDDVNNAAKRLMLPDQIQWVIVGDRAKIEQGIREMGIKDIYFVDGDGNPVK